MKKISKNVLLVSSVGLAGSAFAVTNTHPVFAANNAATNANSSQDVASAQTQVNEAQKEVDQTQSQLNAAEGQLSTANNNLDQKNADLQKAKEAVDNANSKVASASSDNSSAQSQLDKSQSDVDSANSDYQDAVKEDKDQQQKVADAESELKDKQGQLDEIHKKNSDINAQIDSTNSDINNYQSQISDLQKKKDELTPKLDAAQEALNAKQQKIDAATQDLQKAQKDLGEATSTNEQFPLPQSYIDYVTGKSIDWDTATKDLQEAAASYTSPFADGDASDNVYDDPSALSDSDRKRLNLYVKNLIDSINSQVGSTNKMTVTDGSLELAKRYTQKFQSSNEKLFRKNDAIKLAASNMGLVDYAVIGYDIAADRHRTTKMSEIAKAAFDLITQQLADPSTYKHIIDNNCYLSVAVTTQDDKFYVCFLPPAPSPYLL